MEREREGGREKEGEGERRREFHFLWCLQRKHEEDEAVKKDQVKAAELARLERETVRERCRRSEAAFSSWKNHKDMAYETERQLSSRLQRSMTPPARGEAEGVTFHRPSL